MEHVDQHPQSPHRYLTEDFTVGADDIVIDGGAVEGNFGLRVVEHVKKLYLFEPESYWQEPLQATFEPWKDKVVIVPKYLSKQDTETAVALDAYFTDKEKPTFIKLDVEGFEADVLEGAADLLATSIKRAVVCTYHYADDEAKLSTLMRACHFSVAPSRGYMLFQLYDKLKPPYFRRALIRCERTA